MTTLQINHALSEGRVEEPGIIVIRGARQYGKSTWLQRMLEQTVTSFGGGTAFFLNGDEILDHDDLREEIRTLIPLYPADAPVRRLFIDEITAVGNWYTALKLLADQGELHNVLVVTTGSQADDLRHGAERLPGRKGRLPRSSFILAPVSFSHFAEQATGVLEQADLVPAYILTGGSALRRIEPPLGSERGPSEPSPSGEAPLHEHACGDRVASASPANPRGLSFDAAGAPERVARVGGRAGAVPACRDSG